MREILSQRLWIGNAREARDVRGVLDLGIVAVIDLAMEEPPISYPRDVTYCRFPLVDGGGNSAAVLRAAVATTVEFLRSNVPTLVACSAGMSRSPALVAAALSRTEAITPEDALQQITAFGPHDVSLSLWRELVEVL
jgi:protein-tyrosine phosphatase